MPMNRDEGRAMMDYEEGRRIEGEFILSWDAVERFYQPGNVR